MPPKPAAGKKGKEDLEDYSDVHTLPLLNSIIISILPRYFFSTETREKVQKVINEKILTDPRIKTVTRDELLAYAKLKQIIVEPNIAATLPQDDPRLKMTEADQLAKAACDKIFELSVQARRAKKEKIQKLEEEMKAQQQQDPNHVHKIDDEQLDTIFNLVDFPNTKQEAFALSKWNMNLNVVIDINQDIKTAQTEEEQEAFQRQEYDQQTDQENSQKYQNKIIQLKDARSQSVKNSAIRLLMIDEVKFFNIPQVSYKTNEQGEEVEEIKEAFDQFGIDLLKKVEHQSSVYLKYLKFREKVPLIPLMPDKQAIQEIEELQRESEEFKLWLQEGEQLTLNQSQKDLMSQSQVEDREQRKTEFLAEKQQKVQEEEERQQRLKLLRGNLKVSLDDTKPENFLKLDQYNSNFLKYKETQNCISSIMSSMITSIAAGENHYIQTQENDDPSTQDETIDDLLDKTELEVYRDMFPGSRDAYDYQRQTEDYSNFQRQRRQGTEAFASQTSALGDIEYHEENDKTKLPLYKLPKEVSHNDEEKIEEICVREKEVLQNLLLPGLDRHLMPEVPSKSQRIRDQERPQLYPFSTLPVEDAERALIMRAFQDLMKSNFIDEGQPFNTKSQKYKAFDRNYESHMKPEILRQVMADAFLKDPDIATLYYPRNDSLLVALYNKVKDIHDEGMKQYGEKEWRAAYRVMPDFENWVKYFSEEVLIQSQQTKPDGNQTLKYQFDDEMIPDQMIDIDDQKIGNISESSKLFYPPDGSIMKCDTYTISGQTYKKSVVYKDNLVFGLRLALQEEESEEKEYGLYKFKKYGQHEFYMNFENDTKMLVDKVKAEQNPQKLIRIDPPKPTPEEIAAREEAIKQAQAAAAKNKSKSALANIPVIEEYKPPEPTWEPEPLDFFDNELSTYLYNNVNEMIQVTSTFTNGLIVKHLGDGNILQMTEDQLFDQFIEEKDRMIMQRSGVVVRHMRNRDAELLFPNGVVAKFDKAQMMWTITNNKGRRTSYKNGIRWDIDPIPCATETDAVTNAKMMIREDKVMTIQFKDGSLYCQHADGTLMKTNSEQNQIRIEKQGYAPVIAHQLSWQQPGYEAKETFERQRGSYVMETYMPDGTVVETFVDSCVEKIGVRHLFRRSDFSIISVDETGLISIVSSNTRSSLNELYGKRLLGQDQDYYLAFQQNWNSFNMIGTYHAYINENSRIFTVDDTLQKFYQIDSNLELSKVESQYGYYIQQQTMQQIQNQPSYGDEEQQNDHQYELEDVGGYKNPMTKNYIYPRLFVVNADGSGYELLSRDQLDYYFRIAKHRPESLKQRTSVMVGTTLAKTHYFVTRVKNMWDFEIEQQQLKSLDFPQNAQYALLHNKLKDHDKKPSGLHHMPYQYQFKQIFEFQEFETYKQEAFYDDFNRYRQWKMSQVRYDTEFGIVHVPAKDQVLDYKKIEDDEYFARRIITKIMKERRKGRQPFDPDFFKRKFINDAFNSNEVVEFQRRNTINDREDRSLTRDGHSTAPMNERPHAHIQIMENQQNEKIKNVKKKQEQFVEQQLQEIRRMINTPTFLPAYFQSKEGQQFTKNNPQKPPSQEMIMRMSQRINRSQNNTEKGGNSQFDGNQSMRDNQAPLMQDIQNQQQDGNQEENHSPIVALQPEDNYGNGRTNFMGSKKGQTNGGPQPSLYLQEKMYIKQKEMEQILKSEEYHVIKTKDFNVVGKLREEKPFVKSIQKSKVQSELNEKFITTECIADRRVKISSMAGRQYINAPSIEDVRKQGQHQMILSAINKKQTFAELINQANSMVTSVLHDPLKRSVNIMPSQLKFGFIQTGAPGFEMILTLKNEDQLAQRVTVKPLNDRRIIVQQLETGPIATGMTRKISVTIMAHEECNIKEILQIVTKTDIYKIPIEAQVLSPENYQKELQEQRALNGKNLTNSRVRNKLNDSIIKGRQSAQGHRNSGGGYVEGGSDDDMGGMGRAPEDWLQTTNSQSKLPQIPNAEKRPFQVDPKKPLNELLKR